MAAPISLNGKKLWAWSSYLTTTGTVAITLHYPVNQKRSSLSMNAAAKGGAITLVQASGTLSSSHLSQHRKQNFSISLSISSVITVAFDGLLTTEASLLWDSARAGVRRTERLFRHRSPPPISGPCHRWWPLRCSFNRTTSGTSCSLSAPVGCGWVERTVTCPWENPCQGRGQIWERNKREGLFHALNIKLPWPVMVFDNICKSR